MRPLNLLNPISIGTRSDRHDQNDAIKAEFGRLMHAAVINKGFRTSLLNNPVSCIEAGYCGENFHFPFELKDRINQIKAHTLEEFASQVIKLINMPSVPEMAPVFCN